MLHVAKSEHHKLEDCQNHTDLDSETMTDALCDGPADVIWKLSQLTPMADWFSVISVNETDS